LTKSEAPDEPLEAFQKRLADYSAGRETWFHCQSINQMEAFYRSRIPSITAAARMCGYAIGVHGSLRRDLDLIAVPWVEGHESKDVLARSIQAAACGITNSSYQWEAKPLGRVATAFPIAWHDWHPAAPSTCCVDLSVMLGPRFGSGHPADGDYMKDFGGG
jgi:hypothetical protein